MAQLPNEKPLGEGAFSAHLKRCQYADQHNGPAREAADRHQDTVNVVPLTIVLTSVLQPRGHPRAYAAWHGAVIKTARSRYLPAQLWWLAMIIRCSPSWAASATVDPDHP